MLKLVSLVLVAGLAAGLALGCGDSSTTEEMGLPEADVEESYPFDEPPVLTKFEAPTYPTAAREKSLEGMVTVRVLVNEKGTVDEAVVLEASDPVFEAPSLTAATQCEFTPAKRGGQPTKSQVMIPFEFKLN